MCEPRRPGGDSLFIKRLSAPPLPPPPLTTSPHDLIQQFPVTAEHQPTSPSKVTLGRAFDIVNIVVVVVIIIFIIMIIIIMM